MPWIGVTLPESAAGQVLDHAAAELAAAAARVLDLEPTDVVVLLTVASDSAGSGALITVAGRPRQPDQERALAERLRAWIADRFTMASDCVAVVRQPC